MCEALLQFLEGLGREKILEKILSVGEVCIFNETTQYVIVTGIPLEVLTKEL